MNPFKQKQEVFRDFLIPWPEEIESKYKREIKAHPGADPELILDRICRPYFEYAFDHEAETYIAYLRQKYRNRNMLRSSLKNLLGEENFEMLVSEGYLEQVPYTEKGNYYYRIKEN